MASLSGENSSGVAIAGRALVRRFTDTLKGDTALEQATKDAEEDKQALEERLMYERLGVHYQSIETDQREAYFHRAEVVRKRLDATCQEFLKETEKSSKMTSLFRLRRKIGTRAANTLLQNNVASSIEELGDMVQRIESSWKKKQSKAYQSIRKCCSHLYSHKLAFALVPSQNDYTSSLCGGVTLLISAAVNYDDIAESLSAKVADISIAVSRIALLLGIIGTQNMFEVYANLHAQVFIFYRDVVAWYLERKLKRFIGSFNERLNLKYNEAAEKIHGYISEMEALARTANTAMLSTICKNMDEVKRNTLQTRQELAKSQMGASMHDMLFLHAESGNFCSMIGIGGKQYKLTLRPEHEPPSSSEPQPVPEIEASIVPERGFTPTQVQRLSREKALEQSAQLLPHVIGGEGYSLFKDGRFWIPDREVSPSLARWSSPQEPKARLWIGSPAASGGIPSSRAAAMTTAMAAWQSSARIVSHFCERPDMHRLLRGPRAEKASLIGLTYSLIRQLLQFRVPDDTFEISEEAMESLDGSEESWAVALSTFSDLLYATPQLEACIIDDLNMLSFSPLGEKWCTQILEILFEYQESCEHEFRVLLSTSGNATIIIQYFSIDEQVYIERNSGVLS